MSGSSSSKSASTTTTNNVDKRLVVDNGGVGVSADSSNVSVSVLDGGAVNAAISLAKFSGDNQLKGYEDLLGLTKDTFGSVFDIVKKNTDTVDHITSTVTSAVQDARNSELKATNDNRYLVAAGLAVVGIVAVKVWSK